MNSNAAKTVIARLRVDLKVYTRHEDGAVQVFGLPSPAGSAFDERACRDDERAELAAAILGGKNWITV